MPGGEWWLELASGLLYIASVLALVAWLLGWFG